jgi:hypothetical protein
VTAPKKDLLQVRAKSSDSALIKSNTSSDFKQAPVQIALSQYTHALKMLKFMYCSVNFMNNNILQLFIVIAYNFCCGMFINLLTKLQCKNDIAV